MQKLLRASAEDATKVPDFWECSCEPDMQLAMKVPANQSETQKMKQMAEHGLDKVEIVSIHRVENPRLWKLYHR